MTTMLAFKQVDVFTARPYLGNPVAVILDAQGLSDDQMQQIARWTNLSETTFVLPATVSGADYRARIFTPRAELPFAGHPTLGTAHAVLEARRAALHDGVLTQECGVGLVRLRHTGPGARLALELPRAELSPVEPAVAAALTAAVGLPLAGTAFVVNLGPRWLTSEVASIEHLLDARVDFAGIATLSRELGITGVTLFARDGTATEVRSFAPAHGIDEDPVCGSGNGAVALVLRSRGPTASYGARQGRPQGRDGYVYVEYARDGSILLGGDAVTCIDGQLAPPVPTPTA